MKFQCQVRVLNRTHRTRSSPYYVKSTIALGKETHSDNDYFLLLFTSPIREVIDESRYSKYRLRNNRTQIFPKCLNDGRITLSFEDPPHDLFIQSDVSQLTIFLEIVKACIAGELDALKLSPGEADARQRYNQYLNLCPTAQEGICTSNYGRSISPMCANIAPNCPDIPASYTDIPKQNVLCSPNDATEVVDSQPSASCSNKRKRGQLQVEKNRKVSIDKDTVIMSSIKKIPASNCSVTDIPPQNALQSSSSSRQVGRLQIAPTCIGKDNQKVPVHKDTTTTVSSVTTDTMTTLSSEISQQNTSSLSILTEVKKLQLAPICSGKKKLGAVLKDKEKNMASNVDGLQPPLLCSEKKKGRKFLKNIGTINLNDRVSTTISSKSLNTESSDSLKDWDSLTLVKQQNDSSFSIASNVDGSGPPLSCSDKKKQDAILKDKEKKNLDNMNITTISSISNTTLSWCPNIGTDMSPKNVLSGCGISCDVDELQLNPTCYVGKKQGAVLKDKKEKGLFNTDTNTISNSNNTASNFSFATDIQEHNDSNSFTISSKIDTLQPPVKCIWKKKQGAFLIHKKNQNMNDTVSSSSKNTASSSTNNPFNATEMLQQDLLNSSCVTSEVDRLQLSSSCSVKKKQEVIPKHDEIKNLSPINKITASNSLKSPIYIPPKKLLSRIIVASEAKGLSPDFTCTVEKKQGAALNNIDSDMGSTNISLNSSNTAPNCPLVLSSSINLVNQNYLSGLSIASEVNSQKILPSCRDMEKDKNLQDNKAKRSAVSNDPASACPENLTTNKTPQNNLRDSSIASEEDARQPSPTYSHNNKRDSVVTYNSLVVEVDQVDKGTNTLLSISKNTASNNPSNLDPSSNIPHENELNSSNVACDFDRLQPASTNSDENKIELSFYETPQVVINQGTMTEELMKTNNSSGCPNIPPTSPDTTIVTEDDTVLPSVSNISNVKVGLIDVNTDKKDVSLKADVSSNSKSTASNYQTVTNVQNENILNSSSIASEVVSLLLKNLTDKDAYAISSVNKNTASKHLNNLDLSTDSPQENVLNSMNIVSDVDEMQPAPTCSCKNKQGAVLVEKEIKDSCIKVTININAALKCPNTSPTSTDVPHSNALNNSSIAKEVVALLLKNVSEEDTTPNTTNNENVASKCSNNLASTTDILQQNVSCSSSIAKEIVALLKKHLIDKDTAAISYNINNTASNCPEMSANIPATSTNIQQQNELSDLSIPKNIVDVSSSSRDKKRGAISTDENITILKDKNTRIKPPQRKNIASHNPNNLTSAFDHLHHLTQQRLISNSNIPTGVDALPTASHSFKKEEEAAFEPKNKMNTSIISSVSTNTSTDCYNIPATFAEIQPQSVLSSSSVASGDNTLTPSASCNKNDKCESAFIDKHIKDKTESSSISVSTPSYSGKKKLGAVPKHYGKQDKSAISSSNTSIPSATSAEILKQNVLRSLSIDSVAGALQSKPICTCRSKTKKDKFSVGKKVEKNKTSISSDNIYRTASACPIASSSSTVSPSRISSEVNVLHPFRSRKNRHRAVLVTNDKKGKATITFIKSNTASNYRSIPHSTTSIEPNNNSSNTSEDGDTKLSAKCSCQNKMRSDPHFNG